MRIIFIHSLPLNKTRWKFVFFFHKNFFLKLVCNQILRQGFMSLCLLKYQLDSTNKSLAQYLTNYTNHLTINVPTGYAILFY